MSKKLLYVDNIWAKHLPYDVLERLQKVIKNYASSPDWAINDMVELASFLVVELNKLVEKVEKPINLPCFSYHVEEAPFHIQMATNMKFYIQDGANEPVWFMGLFKTAEDGLDHLHKYVKMKVKEHKEAKND